MGEAHNGHLVPLACSQTVSFSVPSPTREHSSAAAQHGSASLPVLKQTRTPGRSYTRLSNPIRSVSKRDAAMSHYSCAALPHACHFTRQALSYDGDQDYLLSMWPAPFPHPRSSGEIHAGDRQLTPQLFPSPGKSTGGGTAQKTLHLTCGFAAAAQTHGTTWWTSRQVSCPRGRISNAICHCRELQTPALPPPTPP